MMNLDEGSRGSDAGGGDGGSGSFGYSQPDSAGRADMIVPVRAEAAVPVVAPGSKADRLAAARAGRGEAVQRYNDVGQIGALLHSALEAAANEPLEIDDDRDFSRYDGHGDQLSA